MRGTLGDDIDHHILGIISCHFLGSLHARHVVNRSTDLNRSQQDTGLLHWSLFLDEFVESADWSEPELFILEFEGEVEHFGRDVAFLYALHYFQVY